MRKEKNINTKLVRCQSTSVVDDIQGL